MKKNKTKEYYEKNYRLWFEKKIIRQRGWKIVRSGTMDGFTKSGIWKWYIVCLP